jgi:uncharacterized membrane protein YagU involved in acid resistance
MARRKAVFSHLGSDLVYGSLAGAVGAACMTPLRIAARRAGLIDKTVPQVIEEALAHKLGISSRSAPAQHHLADHLLHLGYGSMQGAIYRLATRRSRGSIGKRGLLFGALCWLVGRAVVVPLLDATRPIWRSRPGEKLIDLGSHALYGLVTALLADDLPRQRQHRPTSDARRRLTSVG